MSRIPTPENIEIAALRKKAEIRFDPMAPGPGTPWEDRGTHGTAGAFFKTVGMSLFSPGKLAAAVRRPETTGDASTFLIICAVCWGISAFIHGMIWMHQVSRQPDVVIEDYVIDTIIAAVAAGVGLWLLFRLYNLIYGKLVVKEKGQTPLPAALIYNVNAYALGPSVLAIIPYIGPPLALLWIAIDLIAAGMSRLHLRFAAALIDTLIPLVVVVAIAFAGYWVGNLLVWQVLEPYSVQTSTHTGSSSQ